MHLHITHIHTEYDRGRPGYSDEIIIRDRAGRLLAEYAGPGTDIDRPLYTGVGIVPLCERLTLQRDDTVLGRRTRAWVGSMPLTSLPDPIRRDVTRAWIRARRLPQRPSEWLRDVERRGCPILRLAAVLRADGWSAEDAWYHARHCVRLAARVQREARLPRASLPALRRLPAPLMPHRSMTMQITMSTRIRRIIRDAVARFRAGQRPADALHDALVTELGDPGPGPGAPKRHKFIDFVRPFAASLANGTGPCTVVHIARYRAASAMLSAMWEGLGHQPMDDRSDLLTTSPSTARAYRAAYRAMRREVDATFVHGRRW